MNNPNIASYEIPVKIQGEVLVYKPENFEDYIDALLVIRATNELMSECAYQSKNIIFPVVLAEIAKVLKIKTADNFSAFCSTLETKYYELLHKDIAGMIGAQRDWADGAKKVREAIVTELSGGCKLGE